MKRKLTKYFVIILAILLAQLVHAYAQSFLAKYLTESAPFRSVAISMVITVLVFYPAFYLIHEYVKNTSKKHQTENHKVTKKRFLGLAIGFTAALFLLFAAFSQVWYHKNPILDVRIFIESCFN